MSVAQHRAADDRLDGPDGVRGRAHEPAAAQRPPADPHARDAEQVVARRFGELVKRDPRLGDGEHDGCDYYAPRELMSRKFFQRRKNNFFLTASAEIA